MWRDLQPEGSQEPALPQETALVYLKLLQIGFNQKLRSILFFSSPYYIKISNQIKDLKVWQKLQFSLMVELLQVK